MQIIVKTPLGTFKSQEQTPSSEEKQQIRALVKSKLDYLSFTDEDENEVIIKKETLNNSVIILKETE